MTKVVKLPEIETCVICKGNIMPDPNGWAGGHNAQPVANGQCCGACNSYSVIPARINEYLNRERKNND